MADHASGRDPIRVGIIGLTPGSSWAARAHVPALRALPSYELVGVANSTADSARAAASALGIPRAFASPEELAADPGIDLVVVTVKVPHHRALVDAALDAGAMVHCEWPLGVGLADAQAMARRASDLGVRATVGLQARCAPTVRYVRDLVRDGYVGQVLSTTLVGSSGTMGAIESASRAYLNDKENGANVLTIPAGHALDALAWVLGDFRQVTTTLETRRRTFAIAETGEVRTRSIADQVIVGGVLEGGTVVSIHYRGGTSRGTNLRWEINGTDGDLVVTGASGHLQATEPTLHGARGSESSLSVLVAPDEYRVVPDDVTGPALNVAQAYVRLAEGPSAVDPTPDFADAVRLHRLLDAIEVSAATGQRVSL